MFLVTKCDKIKLLIKSFPKYLLSHHIIDNLQNLTLGMVACHRLALPLRMNVVKVIVLLLRVAYGVKCEASWPIGSNIRPLIGHDSHRRERVQVASTPQASCCPPAVPANTIMSTCTSREVFEELHQ